jgi:hypothetical protein
MIPQVALNESAGHYDAQARISYHIAGYFDTKGLNIPQIASNKGQYRLR